MNEEFRSRLVSTLQKTVQAWDSHPSLLRDCRQSILQSKFYSEYSQKRQQQQQEQIRDGTRHNLSTKYFMKHFVKYFQNHVMIWCDRPTCHICSVHRNDGDAAMATATTVQSVGIRGPITPEESSGHANRVEVYQCTICSTELTFPRYNNVSKLYTISSQIDPITMVPQQRTPGRCGEYANLFGLYCRALGLETRYILDFTDHVWIEILLPLPEPDGPEELFVTMTSTTASPGTDDTPVQWCMLDPCEGVMNEYSMYEHGWGKALDYCVAISSTCLIDVTTKYTRSFHTTELQARRRAITTSEYESSNIIEDINQSILISNGSDKKSNLSSKERKIIQQRYKEELVFLHYLSSLKSWSSSNESSNTAPLYQMGRVSGSQQWKASRQEIGNQHGNNNNESSIQAETEKNDNNNNTTAPTITIQERYPWLGSVDTAYNTSYHYHYNMGICNNRFEIYLTPPARSHRTNGSSIDDGSRGGIDVITTTTIRIDHVPCATANTTTQQLSIVVMDENFSSESSCIGGCILQSMVCCTIPNLIQFLSSIPPQRIVIIVGTLVTNPSVANANEFSVIDDGQLDMSAERLRTMLGDHFNVNYVYTDGIIYMGQLLVTKQPDWSYCGSYSMTPKGIKFVILQLPLPNNDNSNASTEAASESTPLHTSTKPTARILDTIDPRHQGKLERYRLKRFRNARPQSITGRVPDTIMTLSEQLVAGYEKKRTAFLSFLEQGQYLTEQEPYVESLTCESRSCSSNNVNARSQPCYGYTTTNGAPIYILGQSSYPIIPCYRQLQQGHHVDGYSSNNHTSNRIDCWNTFLVLPAEIVPYNDDIMIDDSNTNIASPYNNNINATTSTPQYDIPIDQEFFQQELGSHILTSFSSSAQDQCRLPTKDALHNARLVAYYFSAHWCGPCRSFTPILAEMYTALKKAYPCHGLEIVFISSDRDEDSFNLYFSNMPWLAVPYSQVPLCKQALSAKYNVRGIPSLVVVDSISGQVVINNTESRALVIQTCHGGTDESICSMFSAHWLSKTPVDSQQLLGLLAMSNFNEPDRCVEVITPVEFCSYIVRNEFMEQQNHIEMVASQLKEDNMDEAEAYATAQQAVELSMIDCKENTKRSCLDGLFKRIEISCQSTEGYPPISVSDIAEQILKKHGEEQLDLIFTTILKYLNNCFVEPWNPKYRKFQLSFKVADSMIAIDGGIKMMEAVGFEISCTTEDYNACIPIPMDLEQMKTSIMTFHTHFKHATKY